MLMEYVMRDASSDDLLTVLSHPMQLVLSEEIPTSFLPTMWQ
jgi:hypothetical protein